MSKFWKGAFILFALFVISTFYHYHKDWPNPNETVRLYLALAITERGSFNIDEEINRYGVIWDRAVYKGKIYSDKAPGLSFAAVPSLVLNKLIHKHIVKKAYSLKTAYLVAITSTSLLSAIISILFLFKLLEIYGISKVASLLTCISLIPGTYVTTYSMLFFGHQFSASLLFISFVLIEIYIREKRNPFYIALSAFLSSFAFISEYPTIVISLLMLIYLFISTHEKKIFLYSTTALLPVILLMYYLTACFGSPFSTGYQHLDSETFSRIHSEGLIGIKYPSYKAFLGLLFGSQRGLFFYSPVLVFALMYLIRSRLKTGLMRFLAGISVIYALLFSSFGYWIGGDAAGARHLLPLNYFLMIPLAFFIEENLKNYYSLSIFFGLLLISIHNIIVTNLSWPFFPPQFLNPLVHFSYILIEDGYITHSILNTIGIHGFSAVSVYLLIVLTPIIATIVFLIKNYIKGYVIILEIVLAGLLCINLLFFSRPDEGNYREIIRIERSFDPAPSKFLPSETTKRGDYKICVKRGNVLIKSGEPLRAIKEYRCRQ